MGENDKGFDLARAEEEDRRVLTSMGAARAVHLQLAVAYRQRVARSAQSAQPAPRWSNAGWMSMAWSGGSAQAAMEVVIVESRDRGELGDIGDHQRAMA